MLTGQSHLALKKENVCISDSTSTCVFFVAFPNHRYETVVNSMGKIFR